MEIKTKTSGSGTTVHYYEMDGPDNTVWHRLDGPALYRPNGNHSYYIHGYKFQDVKEFNWVAKHIDSVVFSGQENDSWYSEELPRVITNRYFGITDEKLKMEYMLLFG